MLIINLLLLAFTHSLIVLKQDSKVLFLVNNYNTQRFQKIYAQFNSNLKAAITQTLFIQQMDVLYHKFGTIQYHNPIQTGQIFCICQNNLDSIVIVYLLDSSNLFSSFVISAAIQSTFSFFKNNVNNPKIALSFSTNKGSLNINPNNFLSLCSVYKITIVIQYSKQVSQNILNSKVCVPLDYINRYYLTHIDTSHAQWLKTISGNCAKLEDIVIGMIRYSSNANAQFLTDLVGAQNIDKTVKQLGLNQSKTLYIASSMLAMRNDKNLSREQYLRYLKSLSFDQVLDRSIMIHQNLKAGNWDKDDEFYLDGQIIDIHVQLIQKSSSAQYLRLMQKINSPNHFDLTTLNIIYSLFDNITKSSSFGQTNYIHAGAKGGSANYNKMNNAVLAVAGYSKFMNGTTCEYSMIITGLDSIKFGDRLIDLNRFILSIQLSEYYVVQFIKRINMV